MAISSLVAYTIKKGVIGLVEMCNWRSSILPDIPTLEWHQSQGLMATRKRRNIMNIDEVVDRPVGDA